MLGHLEAHPETDPVRYAGSLAGILTQGMAKRW